MGILFASVSAVASAHATVKPSEVGVGSFQTFSIGVPNERQIATTAVRLVVPDNLEHVMPSVKPGWRIEVKEKHEEGDTHGAEEMGHAGVSEIIWTAGSIPVGQRDDFSFSAKVPSTQSDVVWKIYQTYQDGSTVAWDLGKGEAQPQKDGKPDFSSKGPASITKVVDDLSKNNQTATMAKTEMPKRDKLAPTALALSAIAVIASAVAIAKK